MSIDRALAESYRYCSRLTRSRAGNFYYSFLPLPAVSRREMCALYAYMRVCDDIADDEAKSVAIRRIELYSWRSDVEAALAGEAARHPVLPALADVVRLRDIPTELLFDVLTGVASDLDPTPIDTFADLERYCYHVAGAVGLCCIHIWGFDHTDDAKARAIDCGLAFQLTNILRDLREDALSGRAYIPREDFKRFGVTVESIADGTSSDDFNRLMKFETDRAAEYYSRAGDLFAHLDPAGRPVLKAMMRIYGGLLSRIRRAPEGVLVGRVSLPRWKKLLIAADAVVRPAATPTSWC
ncbi:phytoene/squalene synthase family protein [Stratiformator vulcanicus]|uniref:All-trans-phytoene synthase n=1 Tax=Stratiformator vulcanicus TaxID=2527980 RepID=A0A517R3K3_9PLAN|nr:phytoene/squalene synthase family protein [Stratiformator vulcanicus]QDT38436.1 All-trans-phytoene synthase [Stratiformator vulcanicus]